ncbi:MAG: type II toxin-antitoxin system Phd/YefM family antitoxin [Nitrospirae bacterium]|nr:type II toxin-antitoxin system Phd/YefM family antitoxin [Nitrospirota bacterium]
MKSVTISALKAGLSAILRQVRRGERIIILDRREPVAEIVPFEKRGQSSEERLVREGRLRPATRRWSDLRSRPLGRSIGLGELLDSVREDSE